MVIVASFMMKQHTFYFLKNFFSAFIVQFGFYFFNWIRDRDIFPQFQSANSGVGKPDIVG
jgi:hypothetical protein